MWFPLGRGSWTNPQGPVRFWGGARGREEVGEGPGCASKLRGCACFRRSWLQRSSRDHHTHVHTCTHTHTHTHTTHTQTHSHSHAHARRHTAPPPKQPPGQGRGPDPPGPPVPIHRRRRGPRAHRSEEGPAAGRRAGGEEPGGLARRQGARGPGRRWAAARGGGGGLATWLRAGAHPLARPPAPAAPTARSPSRARQPTASSPNRRPTLNPHPSPPKTDQLLRQGQGGQGHREDARSLQVAQPQARRRPEGGPRLASNGRAKRRQPPPPAGRSARPRVSPRLGAARAAAPRRPAASAEPRKPGNQAGFSREERPRLTRVGGLSNGATHAPVSISRHITPPSSPLPPQVGL
jgi:hypothetical protein